jgi:hypothetical protein
MERGGAGLTQRPPSPPEAPAPAYLEDDGQDAEQARVERDFTANKLQRGE